MKDEEKDEELAHDAKGDEKEVATNGGRDECQLLHAKYCTLISINISSAGRWAIVPSYESG